MAKKKEGERISPTDALRLLRRSGIEPIKAAAELTKAIHSRAAFPVWCNDKAVQPHVRPDIRVVARERNGRWAAEVQSISHQWHGAQYRWEFDAAEVRALRKAKTQSAEPMEQQRRTPGKKPTHEWQKHVTREVVRLAFLSKTPTAPDMLKWCADKWDWQPDIRQMQRLLRDLLT